MVLEEIVEVVELDPELTTSIFETPELEE